MAITAFPFDDQDTTEGQFSQWARELADSGIADSWGGIGLQPSGGAGGMFVRVQPGIAILRGFAFSSTAVESIPLSASGTAQRYDLVVARIDPTTNLGTFQVIKGIGGDTVPTANQTDNGIFETPIAIVTVQANATTIDAAMVQDVRQYVGSRTGSWTTQTRPASPRQHKLGFNVIRQRWEFYNGSAWVDLFASQAENTTNWNGYSLTVSATQPSGTPTTDRIWIQPTS